MATDRRLLTTVSLLLLGAAPARAEQAKLSALELRFAAFAQDGLGFQSQAAPTRAGPGSEEAWILQPSIWLRFDRADDYTLEASLAIDVVSAASPDAIDVTTSASRLNESADLRIAPTWHDQRGSRGLRFGLHFEEPLRSAAVGAMWLRRLADDNASVGLSTLATFDLWDHLDPRGVQHGQAARLTWNGNLEASQVLSATTLLTGGYGLTLQVGDLENTWNVVPIDESTRGHAEEMPGFRARHAFAAQLAQHLPWTRSSLRLGYRFYLDSFGLTAHTGELRLYQYLGDWIYLRGRWREHRQDGVDFFVTALPVLDEPELARTADSDLAPFAARQLGIAVVLMGGRAARPLLHGGTLGLSFDHYRRDNGLTLMTGAVWYRIQL